MSVKIAIYCCNYVFGEGIKCILNEDSNLTVINCLYPNDVNNVHPNLVIADFRSVSLISLDKLFENGTMLLLLEISGLTKIEEESVLSFISKGLVGILTTTTDTSNFRKAIKSVCSGELWIERKKLKDIIAENNIRAKEASILTDREMEIVKMVCRGYRNKEIMQNLNVSEQAVKSHLHRIFRKVGVCDRLQLALYVMKHYPGYLSN